MHFELDKLLMIITSNIQQFLHSLTSDCSIVRSGPHQRVEVNVKNTPLPPMSKHVTRSQNRNFSLPETFQNCPIKPRVSREAASIASVSSHKTSDHEDGRFSQQSIENSPFKERLRRKILLPH